MSCNIIHKILVSLQCNALEKLASRAQFQQTGLATLRAKTVGGMDNQINIIIHLSESGDNLRNKIMSAMNLQPTTRCVFCYIFFTNLVIQLEYYEP